MKVEKVHHVAILVKDLEGAGKFFSDIFSIKFDGPRVIKEGGIRNMMSSEGIELVTPLTPESSVAKTLEQRGEGMMLLSLQVPNVAKATADMKAKGVRQIGTMASGATLFHPKDLHGVLIELTEAH